MAVEIKDLVLIPSTQQAIRIDEKLAMDDVDRIIAIGSDADVLATLSLKLSLSGEVENTLRVYFIKATDRYHDVIATKPAIVFKVDTPLYSNVVVHQNHLFLVGKHGYSVIRLDRAERRTVKMDFLDLFGESLIHAVALRAVDGLLFLLVSQYDDGVYRNSIVHCDHEGEVGVMAAFTDETPATDLVVRHHEEHRDALVMYENSTLRQFHNTLEVDAPQPIEPLHTIYLGFDNEMKQI